MAKYAIITGATAGIGKACAMQLAEDGYSLVLLARRGDRLEQLCEDLKAQYTGAEFYSYTLDVRNRMAVEDVLAGLPDEFKKPDLLVNNAGLSQGLEPIYNGDPQDWETMIDTNVKGLLYVSGVVSGWMKEQAGGMIINIGSISAKEVYAGGAVYCATKYAVDAISKGMRIDLLPYNVRVCAVHPGMVETEFSEVRFKGDTERAAAVYKGLQPLRGEDVAEVVSFAAGRPAHVNIDEVIIKPTAQASAFYINRD